MQDDTIVKLLTEILLDKDADEADRDDALIDLRNYKNNPEIESVLINIINDKKESYNFKRDACETLAEVWNNKNSCNPAVLKDMDQYLAQDVKMFTLAFRPEWKPFFDEISKE